MTVDLNRLKKIVGDDNVRADPVDLAVYGSDSSVHQALPEAVVKPQRVEHIQELMAYANEQRIAVVPRGGGSGMCGQTVPVKGGLVLDMKGFCRILENNVSEGWCRVESGVVDDDLNRALKPYGFFFPPTPASSRIATLGGEIANNASGMRSVKYGATRDYVLALRVVLADGSLHQFGTLTRVAATGYPLERLMVGSEGTLGVVVDAVLRYVPIPRVRALGVANFERLEQAGEAVSAVMAAGCQPSMLELIDKVAITAVNRAQKLGLPEVEAILLFEADGMVKEAVEYEIQRLKEICSAHGASGLQYSYEASERDKLSAGRSKLFPSLSSFQEGLASTSLADDMAVPYSRMAECARVIHQVAERHGLVMSAYGHCGAGCMHTKILMDTTRRSSWEAARRAVEEIYQYVIGAGGTTSAEHGIGLSKAGAFQREKQEQLELMSKIKAVFDPNNILNPGKLMQAPADWLTASELRYRQKE